MIFEETRKIQNFIFVVGAQSTKDINEMLKIINPLVSSIIFTKSDNPKASKPQELLRIFNKINYNKKSKAKIINNPKNALDYARKIIKKNELIVATGSIYMIGEVI